MSSRRKIEGFLLVLPITLGCMFFYLIPFLSIVKETFLVNSGENTTYVGLDNYINLFNNNVFKTALLNTARFLIVSLITIIVVAYLIAMGLVKWENKFQLLKSVLLLPYIMPVAGTTTIINLITQKTSLLNEILSKLGFYTTNWLETSKAFGIVVFLYIWKNIGYSVILLLAGLVNISKELYNSAELDGASSLQKFIYITTPHMRYSLFFTFIFSLINAFKCFKDILIIGGAHPQMSIYMLQHFINNCFTNVNYTELATTSVVLFCIIVLLLGILYFYVNKKNK